jgi:hypothetical protein
VTITRSALGLHEMQQIGPEVGQPSISRLVQKASRPVII